MKVPFREQNPTVLGVIALTGIAVGLTVALYSPAIGSPLIGLSLGVLMADTAWHDVARGTVRKQGLPRLAAVCMLSGYAWALVPALMWIVEVIDAIADHRLDQYGIVPRQISGLDGILVLPEPHHRPARLRQDAADPLVPGDAGRVHQGRGEVDGIAGEVEAGHGRPR